MTDFARTFQNEHNISDAEEPDWVRWLGFGVP